MIKNSNKKEKRIQLDFVDKIIDNYLLKIFCKENKIDFTEESSVEIEEQNKNINENENKEDLKINKITLTKQLTQKQQNEFESFKHDFKSQFPRKEAKYDEVLNPEVQKLLQEGVEIDYDILCDKTIADIDNTYSYNYLILERNVLLDLITNKYQGDDLKQKIEEFKKLPFETKNNNKIKTFITENNMINTHVLDAFLQVRLSEDFVKMAIILNEIDNDKNFTLKQLHIDIFNSFLEKSNDILQKK